VTEKNDQAAAEGHIAMARQYAKDVGFLEGAREGTGQAMSLQEAALLATMHATLATMELKLLEDMFRD
jgi:hypothetical protein